jgi:probable rRNA maturation factor
MKVLMSLGEEVPRWSEVFLSRTEIRSLFCFLEKTLKTHKVYLAALEKMKVSKVGAVSIHFCGDVEMRQLQKTYRNLDRSTDVLSFPSLEVAGINDVFVHLKPSERSWGDIVVALPTVSRGAQRARRSEARELQEVLIHAFLHLLGMDHVVQKGVGVAQARAMKKLQKELMRKSALC